VSLDQRHLALPQLYGAPAYARPAPAATGKERPFDRDELPIEAQQSDEERELSYALPSRADAQGGADQTPGSLAGTADRGGLQEPTFGLQEPTFGLRAIARRLLGGD